MKSRPELELAWPTARGVALPEYIAIAGRTGYASISVRPSMYYTARRDGYSDEELRSLLGDAGVVVGCIEPLVTGLPDVPALAEAPAPIRAFLGFDEDDCLNVAEALGAKLITLAHPFGGVQSPERMADVIGVMCERADARGVNLTMEFMQNSGIPDLPAALDIIERVGVRNLGVTVDTWHFFRTGGKVEDLAAVSPEAIMSLQVCDATEDMLGGAFVPMLDRLIPGDGTLPLGPVIATVTKTRPNLRVTAEVLHGGLRRMGAERAANVVAAAFQKIFDELD